MSWDHPNPIFLDFETQSACDIKESGGKLYAEHPSTRVLILSMCIGDVFHVWIPDHIRTKLPLHSRLWPNELKPSKKVELYRGTQFPEAISSILTTETYRTSPLVAHNAYGFDRYIWERFCPGRREWLDTLYLARIAGRHGRLDALGKSLLGIGKDRAKKLLPLCCFAKNSPRGVVYPLINAGDLAAFTTYAIADVELVKRLWCEFDSLNVEEDVIRAHNDCNSRGVAVDENLIDLVEQVSEYSVALAAKEIARLTNGQLTENNIRSVEKVHQWVQSWGIRIVDDAGKLCLRKDVVQRYINSPYIIEENLESATEIPPVVVQVLTLRMKALRITDAKVKKAKKRVSNGRLYDLHTYHQAHTGRASSQGVQIHNLPRPPKGLKLDRLLESFTTPAFLSIRNDSKATFDFIKEQMVIQGSTLEGEDLEEWNRLTVDDVCSALIRPSLMAAKGKRLVICDFATIEARCAAWMADEEKLLTVFRNQDNGSTKYGPYEDFGSRMFGVPIEQVDSTQRQVAKSAVLGAIYGLGPDKFRVYAAAMNANLVKAGVTAEQAIATFRDTYTKIAGFKPQKNGVASNFRTGGIWHKLDKVVKDVVSTGIPGEVAKCQWHMIGRDLVCVLPSGRHIHYPDVKIEDIVPAYCYTLGLPLVPKATVTYQSTRGPKSLYGGAVLENICQAHCRDLLYNAIIEIGKKDERYGVVLHVHDEPVTEVVEPLAEKCLRDVLRIMSTTPDWSDGMPIASEGFISQRFVKKAFKGFTELHSKDL